MSNRPAARDRHFSAIAASQWLSLTLFLVALFATSPAFPESAPVVLVFRPADFAGSHPADALEMLRLLPGFSLIERDEDTRGYAGGAGNVLFDGKAPSGKSEPLESMLRRIPADSIDRIELLRGVSGSIDPGNHMVVANVVRVRDVERQGLIEAGALVASGDFVGPGMRIEYSQQSPTQRFESALGVTPDLDDDSGNGSIRVEGADGNEVGYSRRSEWETSELTDARVAYVAPLSGGELSANASLGRETTREDVTIATEVPAPIDELVREHETVRTGEAGARYRIPVRGGDRLEALIIHRLERLEATSVSREGHYEESLREDTDTSESILRFEGSRDRGPLTMNVAIEGALNTLDSNVALKEDGVPSDVPGSDAEVEEQRLEGSIGTTWRRDSGLGLETSLRIETSTLRQRGDTVSSESFVYVKPRLALIRDWGESVQVRAEIRRDVGQLDFADFVASASLDTTDVTAGAVSLRPQQAWVASVAFERRYSSGGAVVIGLSHELIDDVVDHVLIEQDDELFDAIGNIGNGTRTTLTFELGLPLTPLGWPGARFTSSVAWRDSRVTDPTTGQGRRISGDQLVDGELALTGEQRGGKFGWGIAIGLGETAYEYKFDEIKVEGMDPVLDAHIEFRPAHGWRLRLEALNTTSRTVFERRSRYDELRGDAPADSIERTKTRSSPAFLLTISRSLDGSRVVDKGR
jgi:hypothetical protein